MNPTNITYALNNGRVDVGRLRPAGGGGGGGSLPAWLAAANPAIGQYITIPNSALSTCPPTNPSVLKNASTGPAAKITAYCGAGYNRLTGDYTVGPHGGHLDYGGNEFNAINVFADVPSWVEWAPSSPDSAIYKNTEYNADLRPASKHSYSLTHWVASIGKCIMMPTGGQAFGADYPPGWLYTLGKYGSSFDIVTKTYDSPLGIAPYPGVGDPYGALCFQDPSTEMIYYSNNYGDGFYRYSAFANTWTKLSNMAKAPWYCSSVVDHTRGRALVVGGYDVTAPSIVPLDGSTATLAGLTGPSAAVFTFGVGTGIGNSTLPGMVYDAVNDCYLMFINEGGVIENYRVNASTMYADKPTRTGLIPTSRRQTGGADVGIYNSVQYVPNIGGMAGVIGTNEYTKDMFFLRTS